jgi:hypothetical protein
LQVEQILQALTNALLAAIVKFAIIVDVGVNKVIMKRAGDGNPHRPVRSVSELGHLCLTR